MQSLDGQKLIYKLQDNLQKSGVVNDVITTDLKALRAIMIEEKDPFLTKILRLIYQHIEQFGGFFIAVPKDDDDIEEGVEASNQDDVVGADSLLYLLELIADSKNRLNKAELQVFMTALEEYNG